MAERFDMVLALGRLADEAAQRGENRAAETLREAAKMLFADQAIDRRREWDRGRKRKPPVESGGNGGIGLNPVSPSEVFPHTPFPNSLTTTTTPPGARDVAAKEALYAESVENLQAMLHDRVGDEIWPDVDAFIARRQYQTWRGWLKEMLTILTGGKCLPVDLGQACRDDAALKDPLGTPKGLRTFVASAIAERTNPAAPSGQTGQRRGGVAQRTFDNGRKALEGLP